MALPDTFGLAPGTARTSGIASAAVLAGANYLGAAIDNEANLDAVADVELAYTFQTAPTGGSWKLSFLYALDGTNYEPGAGDGTGTGDVDPAPKCQVAADAPLATSGRLLFGGIPLLPYKLKALLALAGTVYPGTATVSIKTRQDPRIND